MAGQLFLRSYERSDRVYNAMLSRGYTGHLQTMSPHELHRVDYITHCAGVDPYSNFSSDWTIMTNVLSVRDLHFSYHDEHLALARCNLGVVRGR